MKQSAVYAMLIKKSIVLQGGPTFILYGMEVVHMKNKFSFNDLMQFGIFLIALLTFIYLISH